MNNDLDDIFSFEEDSQEDTQGVSMFDAFVVQDQKPRPSFELLQGDQIDCYNDIMDNFIKDKKSRYKLLSGVAGSGKSFLLDVLVQSFIDLNLKVAMTGTTNKAVKQLRRQSQIKSTKVEKRMHINDNEYNENTAC